MPEPVSHTVSGLTIGAFGWAGAAMLGFDAPVLMCALIGSLMAQAKNDPCGKWFGYVLPVIGYSIFALATAQVAIYLGKKLFNLDLIVVAPGMAFLIAFFRFQLIMAGNKILERLPDSFSSKKQGD